jgi:hypothetical protein
MPTHPYLICNRRLVDTLSGADSPSPPQTHPLCPWLAPLHPASPPWRSYPWHARCRQYNIQKGGRRFLPKRSHHVANQP